ncbi:MAG: XdhC family protein [Synechococcales cyanobacterium M58_A2018_015]|nr:XdhC family protein [Synechococcales cyanobacterium M58_A2018_015]
MTTPFHQLAAALTQGAAVLATVTAVRGSVPREVGAKMIIDATGRTYNTIGGGAGEAKVIQQALEVLQTGNKQLVDIDLSGAPNREIQGVCGGWMQVWVERWSGREAQTLVQRILTHLETGQSATLVTPFAANETPYLLPANAPLPQGEVFVEQLQSPPTLLIVGAGHVGEQLAKLAHTIGFQILVHDDRPDWATPDRFPQATRIFHQPIPDLLPHLATYTPLYIALVTRGYQYDQEALHCLLQSSLSWHYLGMIGSEKRVRTVYHELQHAGISLKTLQAIHAPIGLEIGALTPEEIAVSICAELIQVRRCGA